MRKFVVSADRRIILGVIVVFLSLGIGLRFSETASSQQKRSVKTSAKAVPVKGRLAGFGESAPLHEIPEVLDPAGFAKVRSRFEKGTEEVEEKEKNKKNAELVKIAKPTRMANAVSQFGDDAISPAFPSAVPTPPINRWTDNGSPNSLRSKRASRLALPNRNSASDLASSVLPVPVGPTNKKEANG